MPVRDSHDLYDSLESRESLFIGRKVGSTGESQAPIADISATPSVAGRFNSPDLSDLLAGKSDLRNSHDVGSGTCARSVSVSAMLFK